MLVTTPGVNDVWLYHEIHLDSDARDAGTTERPIFHLSRPLHDAVALQVLRAEVPYTLDVFDASTTFFSADILGIPAALRQTGPFPLNGPFTGPLGLAQAIQSIFQHQLDSTWPGLYRFDVSFAALHFRLRLLQASTGAVFSPPPGPPYDRPSMFSLWTRYWPDDVLPQPNLPQATGETWSQRGWVINNDLTLENVPYFPLPTRISLLTDLLGSGGAPYSTQTGNLLCDLHLHPDDRRYRYSAPSPDTYFDLGPRTLQTLSFELRHVHPDYAGRTFLTNLPWTLTLAVLTQKDDTYRKPF